jgi:cystathionine gamma-synthase
MSKEPVRSPETLNAQALHHVDAATGALSPAIHPSSTFIRDEEYQLIDEQFSYGRAECPGYVLPERVLAELEAGPAALLFSSGSAAAVAIVQSLKPGDHIVAPKIMYWGLRNWLISFCNQWGLGLDLFDASDPQALANTVIPGKTKLVWIETPCNPTWEIIDIAAAAAVAHAAGARLAVDSTAATPVLTQAIRHGADIVMHSATKYLNGHCDIVAGALVTAREDEFWERVTNLRAETGSILGSFEAWLLQRGMRTLFLRIQRVSESALALAKYFESDERLEAVIYPGLARHPGHEIARRQMEGGFGGMLSIQVKGGAEAALEVAKKCQVFTRATSFGGVESLIEHRYTIEGERSPIPKDLLRLSIGIESVDDLIADMEQALGTA